MTIDRLLVTRTTIRRVGFKVFDKLDGEFYSVFFNSHGPVPVDQWVDELDFRSKLQLDWLAGPVSYHVGWHFFHHLRDAKLYCDLDPNSRIVCKIRARNILATGIGEYRSFLISVSKEINIGKELYVPEGRAVGI